MDEILKRLARAREQSGLTQAQVARMLGFDSPATISHYESGLRTLSVETLLKLCDIYGVSAVWTITGTNPDFDPAPFFEAAHKAKVAAGDFDKMMDLLEASIRK